jgi:hypothetical protein
MQFTCSSQVQLLGCIAPRFGLIHMPSTAVSIVLRLLSFGAVDCLCGRREIIRLKNHHCRKKHQASLSHHQPGPRPPYVFNFILPGPVFIFFG